MEIKKPELNDIDKERANAIFRYLCKIRRPATKEEICEFIGWDFNTSNERRIRELISSIAKVKPIIATSNKRGYKVATSEEDLAEVVHQWRELDSRIEELAERRKPLIRFYEKHSSRG
jgi:hypothetical protein